jgi:glycosyltransferase involved in cell wall biosynthesis
MSKNLSIIIPCLNEKTSLIFMIPDIINSIGLDKNEYEIIVINSGGTDTASIKREPHVTIFDSPTPLGAPQARNLGVEKASASAFVFADAHLKFQEEWGLKILNDLSSYGDSIIAPRFRPMHNNRSRACGFEWENTHMKWRWLPCLVDTAHEIPFAGGAFLAVNRKVFDLIGKWDSGIKFWGGEDAELSLRTWLTGHRIVCNPSILVRHLFKKIRPYTMDIHYNNIRIAFSHFSRKRLNLFLNAYSSIFSNSGCFTKLLLMNIESGVLDRRANLLKRRIHSDDWFFEKFHMKGWIVKN